MADKPVKTWLQTDLQDKSRLLALSDGLFATVLTVLVLDLRLPDLTQTTDMRSVLVALWPHLFSYAITFLVAGVYWIAHHRVFDFITQSNHTVLWYNLLFLLFVGLLPFSSANLGNRLNPFTWNIYALNMAAIGAMLTLIWGYAATHHLSDPELTPRQARYIGLRRLPAPLIFILSILIETISPGSGLAQWSVLAMVVVQEVVERFFGRSGQSRAQATPADEIIWRVIGILPLMILVALSYWIFTLR